MQIYHQFFFWLIAIKNRPISLKYSLKLSRNLIKTLIENVLKLGNFKKTATTPKRITTNEQLEAHNL